MIKIENTEVFGWHSAIRGMRNPLNSWDKSDSYFDYNKQLMEIGEKDLSLMIKLSKAGSDHGKYLRMINISCDITAPLYWWKEMDTYKIGTTSNSCSTMHRIHTKEFTLDDFSYEHLFDGYIDLEAKDDMGYYENPTTCLEYIIRVLNFYRNKFNKTKSKEYWWQMIQLLPSSYNQRRTWQANYQVLKNIYHARKNHKLDEWHDFCDWIKTLPLAEELICPKGDER